VTTIHFASSTTHAKCNECAFRLDYCDILVQLRHTNVGSQPDVSWTVTLVMDDGVAMVTPIKIKCIDFKCVDVVYQNTN